MLDIKRYFLFLIIYFAFLMIPAYWLPLFETTDARYAEIAREMLASGNFLEPYYNGIKHFHKPPLTYWLNAIGMSIFGVNGFGARFFGALAAVVILIYTRRTALLLSRDEKIADTAFFILASSLLFIVVGHVVSTDIYLTMFTIMSLYYMFRQMYGKVGVSNAFMAGLLVGLGFLTKGPIIFLFTLLPFMAAKFFDPNHRRVFNLIEVLVILAVFASVALPWYLYVINVNDGLLNYFLKDQTVERVATDKFSRSKPFWFFFAIFFGTFLPWAFYMIRNHRFSYKLQPGKALYLYIIMPFIVFELSTSKLGTYLLPFFPVAAVIAAVNTESIALKRLGGAFVILAGVAICVVPFVVDYAEAYMFMLLPFGLLYTVLAVVVYRKFFETTNFVQAFTGLVLLLTFFVYCFIPLVGPYAKGYRLIAEDIKKYDPTGRYDVLIYRSFVPSLSFYLNDVKPIAFSKSRETQFQDESDYRRFLIETEEQLQSYLAGRKELLVYARKKSREDFVALSGYECSDISFRGDKKYVMHCVDKKSPETP